jgi:hypothetical protein
MIENPRSGDRNRYWDHPVGHAKPHEVELLYRGYFDWDELGTRDYQYYLVEIAHFTNHAEVERRQGLVEVCHAVVTAKREPTETDEADEAGTVHSNTVS